MNIRPHHAMCMLNYVGKGYDDAFSKNMTRIIESLNNRACLSLVSEADSLCLACPNRAEITEDNPVGCRFSEKVARYDENLLKTLEISTNESITYGELTRLVFEKVFVNKAKFTSVCGDCEWHYLCETVRFG
ncbi:MAG: DUF1284 domain-containing protein [Christensenellaceae bacterium]|nr:DUF1284 domain-containing protein [Christensenellaceae bacterium]